MKTAKVILEILLRRKPCCSGCGDKKQLVISSLMYPDIEHTWHAPSALDKQRPFHAFPLRYSMCALAPKG